MRAQLADIVLGYDASGGGRPLLLVHGYPLNRHLWQPQMATLGDAARLIAPDLRGHGESGAPDSPHTVERLADDLAELLDGLAITEPVVVGGLSMGGYVALAFYRRYPARVAGLILAATRAGADAESGKANRNKAMDLARAEGVGAIADSMLPKMLAPHTYTAHPELVSRVRHMMADTPLPGVLADLTAMRDRPDSTELLGGILQPVLVIHGQDDQLIPPSEAEATFARLPHGRLALIPSAGHLLNLEQPEAFDAEVRTFLRSF